jgi:hypothetical protein
MIRSTSPLLEVKALYAEFFFEEVAVLPVAEPGGLLASVAAAPPAVLAIAVVPTPFVIGVAVPSPVGSAVFPWVSCRSINTVQIILESGLIIRKISLQ